MKNIKIANQYFLCGDFKSAIAFYEKALVETPELEKFIKGNIQYAKKRDIKGKNEKKGDFEGNIQGKKEAVVFDVLENLCVYLKTQKTDNEIETPFFNIVIYSEHPCNKLRMSLESLLCSSNGLECDLHLICDGYDAKDSYIQGLRNFYINSSKEKIGFYEAVSNVIKSSKCHNNIILKSGVVVTTSALNEIIEKCFISGDYDLISPVTNHTPFLNVEIEVGSNMQHRANKNHALFENKYCVDAVVTDVEIFAFNKSAIDLVPFPSWSLKQDSTLMSLIRWFQALSVKGSKSGILLNTYVHSLSKKCFTNEQLEKWFDKRTSDEICNKYINYKKACIDLENIAFKTHPIVIQNNTIVFLLHSMKVGGGTIVIVNLINQLTILGRDVKVFVRHLDDNDCSNFDILFKPKSYNTVEDIINIIPPHSNVIATFWPTVYVGIEIKKYLSDTKLYYFIQDYETDFYDIENPGKDEIENRKKAERSYILDLNRIYTSDWIKSKLPDINSDKKKFEIKVPVGINLSSFYPYSMPQRKYNIPKKTIIGAMARYSTPRRGYKILIEALKIVKERFPEIEVCLFGENEYKDVNFDFTNLGKLKQEELPKFYRKFDIFVDASIFQGFGLCGLEAMSAGCGCVFTDSGGILEYAENGINCIITKKNPEALSGGVFELINNQRFLNKIGKAAIETSIKFDCINTALEFDKILADTNILAHENPCAVVVPIFNNISIARKCIESVINSLRSSDLLVIINDCSDVYTTSELKKISHKNRSIVLLQTPNNLGFVGASNLGLIYAKKLHYDAILLNSDTLVPEGWIERLVKAAYTGRPAITSPLATESSHLFLELNPGDTFIKADRWLRENHRCKYPEVITPEGWCMYIPRVVYERIGFLDTIFGRGYCEESDLNMRAYAAGFNLRCCDNLLIYHKGKVSFGAEKSELYEKNRRQFDKRWSYIYGQLYKKFNRINPLYGLRKNYHNSGPNLFTVDSEQLNITQILNQDNLDAMIKNMANSYYSKLVSGKSLTFLLPCFLPYGGILSVISLVNELVFAGFDVRLISLSRNGYKGDNLGSLSQPIFIDSNDQLLDCFDHNISIICTSWITVYYAAFVCFHKKVKSVSYYVQDFEPDFPDVLSNKLYLKYSKLTYSLNLKSFCKTDWIRKKVLKESLATVQVVLPAVDCDLFYKRDVKSSVDVIAMYRPNTVQRDPKLLLAVIRLLKQIRPNIRIGLFGDNSVSPDTEIYKYVNVNYGVVSNAQLPLIYSSAKVFLETSIFHGFGRTIAEAMATELPCVITNSGGPEVFAVNNVNCLISQDRSAESLLSLLLKVLDDHDFAIKIAKEARKSILMFSPSESARQIIKFLCA